MASRRRTPLSAFLLFILVTGSLAEYCLQREVNWMTHTLRYAEQQVCDLTVAIQDRLADDDWPAATGPRDSGD